jgi:hypothetical protein
MLNSADATLSNYHHSHNHIHVAETAKFSLDHFDNSTAEWGVVSGRSALKQYFCLMDTDQIRHVNGSSDIMMVRRHTLVAPILCREYQMGGWITTVPVFPASK